MNDWLEIEKKYRLDETKYSEVLSALSELEAEFIGEDFEENKLFTNDYLTEKRAVLRLRKTSKGGFLTYKCRIQNNIGIKQQIEYETEISDPIATEKIIENVGLKLRIVYEKRRKTWKLRNAEIALDELPFGFFMEIEGSIAVISEAEALLGADEYPVEHETYPNLTLRYGKENQGVIEARF
jgi:adenylate cyclase class 2